MQEETIYMNKLLGPILIIAGLFLLDILKLNFSGLNISKNKQESLANSGIKGAFVLGIVFALAFCPYSGVLYFGILIPMTISSASGLVLPFVFAIATGLPVIIVAYLLAFSISSIGGFYNKVKIFEKWFRKLVAILFILVGLYYIFNFYIKA